VSFAEIAKQTPLTEQMVARLLRHAITQRIFREPEPGMVAHTQASKILADPVIRDWLRVGTEEMWPASTKARPLRCCILCFLYLVSCGVDPNSHLTNHLTWPYRWLTP
jgi:hypothetical protein